MYKLCITHLFAVTVKEKIGPIWISLHEVVDEKFGQTQPQNVLANLLTTTKNQ